MLRFFHTVYNLPNIHFLFANRTDLILHFAHQLIHKLAEFCGLQFDLKRVQIILWPKSTQLDSSLWPFLWTYKTNSLLWPIGWEVENLALLSFQQESVFTYLPLLLYESLSLGILQLLE
jgi:hypothetical protein